MTVIKKDSIKCWWERGKTRTYKHCSWQCKMVQPIWKTIPCESCSVVSNSSWPHGLQPARVLCPWNSPGQNTGVGSHSLLQGIFPTQGSNPGILHCRWILFTIKATGKPKKIEEGRLSPLQRIFPTQGSNPGLPHCRRILYQLSHKIPIGALKNFSYVFHVYNFCFKCVLLSMNVSKLILSVLFFPLWLSW